MRKLLRKSWLFMALLLCVVPGAFAEEDGIGLSLGLELGFQNVTDDPVFTVTPNLVYEHSFGSLDLMGELDWTTAFDDPVQHDLYVELEAAYNLQLGDENTLSFILNNTNDTIRIKPELPDGETHGGTLEPSVRYTRTLGFGDLYGEFGLPFDYLIPDQKDETALSAHLTAGWASNFGLGLEFSGTYNIDPDGEVAELGFLPSFEKDAFYGEVEFLTDKKFKNFEINPEIDISFNAWTFTLRAEIAVPDGGDTVISPFIGASYSF